MHVETVVVLRDKKVDGHINVNLDVEKLALQDFCWSREKREKVARVIEKE